MRTRKVDSNQAALVKAIRKIPGVSVLHIHTVGKGCPDILVGYRNKNWLFEIKDPLKFVSQRRLTKDEEVFHSKWQGQVAVIETVDDVWNLIRPGWRRAEFFNDIANGRD